MVQIPGWWYIPVSHSTWKGEVEESKTQDNPMLHSKYKARQGYLYLPIKKQTGSKALEDKTHSWKMNSLLKWNASSGIMDNEKSMYCHSMDTACRYERTQQCDHNRSACRYDRTQQCDHNRSACTWVRTQQCAQFRSTCICEENSSVLTPGQDAIV